LLAQKKETKKSASDSMVNLILTSTSGTNESADIRITPSALTLGRYFVLRLAHGGAGFFAGIISAYRNIHVVEKEAPGKAFNL
jgi:hypothetical protein